MMIQNDYPRFGVLLVDDEIAWLKTLALTLRSRANINNIFTCQDGVSALEMLERHAIGVVLLDLNMPKISGEALLEQILENYPNVIVIVISGLNQIDTVVTCMKKGAFDYYVKTDEEDRIVNGVLRAVRMVEMRQEYQAMSHRLVSGQLREPQVFNDIITCNKRMLSLFTYLEAVAHSPQPILITGESGVGKELMAQAAHTLSGCKGKLVAVNAAGLDDTMFSDTLFGHVKGSYTGADQRRQGLIEQAEGGTLFLDEIGDLSIASQVKLLRLLQEGEYYPLGSDNPKRLNARIIVATHQDLSAKEARGEFRRDLYYRLRAHHVDIPPLRERADDIALLLDAFIAEAAEALNRPRLSYDRSLINLLMGYAFPGNIRELKSMVFDAMSTCRDGKCLTTETFRAAMRESPKVVARADIDNPFEGFSRLPSFSEAANMLVQEAMNRTNNNQTMAARLLGISQPALNKRLKKNKNEDCDSAL